jgi:hypothetical protein
VRTDQIGISCTRDASHREPIDISCEPAGNPQVSMGTEVTEKGLASRRIRHGSAANLMRSTRGSNVIQ